MSSPACLSTAVFTRAHIAVDDRGDQLLVGLDPNAQPRCGRLRDPRRRSRPPRARARTASSRGTAPMRSGSARSERDAFVQVPVRQQERASVPLLAAALSLAEQLLHVGDIRGRAVPGSIHVDEHLEGFANGHRLGDGCRRIRDREQRVADAHHRSRGRGEQATAAPGRISASPRSVSSRMASPTVDRAKPDWALSVSIVPMSSPGLNSRSRICCSISLASTCARVWAANEFMRSP